MAILEGPLFGDEARGQIAKCAIFKRAQVHPQFGGSFYHKQNWTPQHIASANTWRSLCLTWQQLSDTAKQTWADLAPGALTGFNYFMHLGGELPWPPPYVPPDGDNINFNFTLLPYTPPAGDSINFIMGGWPA